MKTASEHLEEGSLVFIPLETETYMDRVKFPNAIPFDAAKEICAKAQQMGEPWASIWSDPIMVKDLGPHAVYLGWNRASGRSDIPNIGYYVRVYGYYCPIYARIEPWQVVEW